MANFYRSLAIYERRRISTSFLSMEAFSHSFGAKSFRRRLFPFITFPRTPLGCCAPLRKFPARWKKFSTFLTFHKTAALESLKLTQFTSHVNFSTNSCITRQISSSLGERGARAEGDILMAVKFPSRCKTIYCL